jgi:hypothetical protein
MAEHQINVLNETDNWIVLGPGRTGSMLIVQAIVFLYRYHKLEFCNKSSPDVVHTDSLEPGNILHSHSISDLRLINKNTKCIINTRSLIEATLSSCIQADSQQSHFLRDHNASITPFYLTPNKFLVQYEQTVQWYKQIKPLIPDNAIIIDYSQFCDDNSEIYKILNYTNLYSTHFKNRLEAGYVKTPGTYRSWITNYDKLAKLFDICDYVPFE